MRCQHDDVKHGFVLAFEDKAPDVDLDELEQKVRADIAADVPICYVDEGHITIGSEMHPCTGPRTHVPSAGHIQGFRIIKKVFYDAFSHRYLIAGRVGESARDEDTQRLNDMQL